MNYDRTMKAALSDKYETYSGRADIYVAFYEQGVSLTKNNGILAYITPNKFFRSGYGTKLRLFLKRNTEFITIIDFGDTPVFDATTYPSVIILTKRNTTKFQFDFLKTNKMAHIEEKSRFQIFDGEYLDNPLWSFEASEMKRLWDKIYKGSIRLPEYIGRNFYRGIVTGLNEAFIIDENQRRQIVMTNPEESEIIKPYLRGRDVKKWSCNASRYIIFTYHGIDIRKYPVVQDYLASFKKKLEKRATSKNHKWYELQQPQTGIYRHYEKPKIISTDIASGCQFTLDNTCSYIDATVFCMPGDDLYLLGLLNSRLLESFYRSISSTVRGDFLRFKKIYLDLLPIKAVHGTSDYPKNKMRDQLVALVDHILHITPKGNYTQDLFQQSQIKQLEREMDTLVYQLYGLTKDEIDTVEDFYTNLNDSGH